MINVEHLVKQYPGVTAVNDISFNVEKNEILGFLGANGAGKSTTLKILTGFSAPTSGHVEVGGFDTLTQPLAVAGITGYQPENVPLYRDMRVIEYLSYRAALKKVPLSKRKKAVAMAIDNCDLGDVRFRISGQLSKGYRQRIGLADALVSDPKVLILDEPTIGLDPNQIRKVRELIKHLGKERTVILSSHILPEVEAICSRILIIHKGKIVGQGKPDELRAKMSGEEISITLEVLDPDNISYKALSMLAGITGVTEKEHSDEKVTYMVKAKREVPVRERIFDTAVESGFKIIGLSVDSMSLEDIYMQITTKDSSDDLTESKSGGNTQ